MAETNLNDDGLRIPMLDLSAESPVASDHGRLYNHDGSSSITLVGGGTTSNKGLYWWDNNAAAWNPLKLTIADADTLDGYDSTAFPRKAEAASIGGGWNFTTAPTINSNAVYHAGNKPGTSDLSFDPATQTELNSHEGTTTAHGDAVPFSMNHANFGTGLSSEEVWRLSLQTGETLEVHRLEMRLKGGGSLATASNLNVDVYDATNATVIASTNAGSVTTGSPAGSSGSGADILVRVTNSSGSKQTASIAGSFYVV